MSQGVRAISEESDLYGCRQSGSKAVEGIDERDRGRRHSPQFRPSVLTEVTL